MTIHGEFDELFYQNPWLTKASHEWASGVFTSDVGSNTEEALKVRWLDAQASVHVAARELHIEILALRRRRVPTTAGSPP